jgi:DNA-binding LacI/PurR family transcriptional regulator
MSKSATLQDVAQKAGVHRSTVSLALRGSPSISLPVRERVQRIAKELNYRSNPLVTALMRSRRTGQEAKHQVLAYVTSHSTRYGWRPPHHDRPDFFPGAQVRALELGYRLEDFWLTEPGMTSARFAQILTSRGIHGLLIGRLPGDRTELDLPWEQFSAVALGLTLKSPQLHRVVEDPFSAAVSAYNHCLRRGHKRIGFVYSGADDSPNTGDRFLGAYLRGQLRLAPEDRLPPCEFTPDFESAFLAWFDRYRPDALLVTHGETIIRAFANAKREFPANVGLVALTNDKLQYGFAGVHQDPAALGSVAVDMLVGMMHRGETGIPRLAHQAVVPGQWIPGTAPQAV